jgi:hypothetical protein
MSGRVWLSPLIANAGPTIASSEQEAASTLVLVLETVSRCLLSLTQAFGTEPSEEPAGRQ